MAQNPVEQAYLEGFAEKCAEAGIDKEALLPLMVPGALAAGIPFGLGALTGAGKNLFGRGQRFGSGAVDTGADVLGRMGDAAVPMSPLAQAMQGRMGGAANIAVPGMGPLAALMARR